MRQERKERKRLKEETRAWKKAEKRKTRLERGKAYGKSDGESKKGRWRERDREREETVVKRH